MKEAIHLVDHDLEKSSTPVSGLTGNVRSEKDIRQLPDRTVGRTGWRTESISLEPTDHYQREIEDFGRAVEEGVPFHADGLDGFRSVEAAAAIIESQRIGRRIAVTHTDP